MSHSRWNRNWSEGVGRVYSGFVHSVWVSVEIGWGGSTVPGAGVDMLLSSGQWWGGGSSSSQTIGARRRGKGRNEAMREHRPLRVGARSPRCRRERRGSVIGRTADPHVHVQRSSRDRRPRLAHYKQRDDAKCTLNNSID